MRPSEARWRVNGHPRFTVLELANYMVAEDPTRERILGAMRYERLRRTTLYRRLYQAIPRFLASPTRDRGILEGCRLELEHDRDTAATPEGAQNATYAIRALDAFIGSLNALPITGWTMERAPIVPPLKFGKVSVSVQPTVHIRVRRMRHPDQAGALLVDPAKGEGTRTDKAKDRATQSMEYAAILVHQHVVSRFPASDPKASTNHCIVFHTHRQQLIRCPDNHLRKLGAMKAVCANIARGWNYIERPPDFDPAFAVHRP